MNKYFLTTIILFLSSVSVSAARLHPEAAYQNKWCKAHNGVTEYKLNDNTRVDCLTTTQAVEFDFADKWAECIGQSLHYGIKTRRKPVCVLIMERGDKDLKYLKRLRRVAYKKGISAYTIKPSYLGF